MKKPLLNIAHIYIVISLSTLLFTFGGCSSSSQKDSKNWSLEPIALVEDAANRGDADAQYILACRYYEDDESTAAAEWFKRAALQGSIKAQYQLIRMYEKGDGVPESKNEAGRWFTKIKKKAKNGDIEAQFFLGYYYLDKRINEDEALKLITKAAKHGYDNAQYFLGSYYYTNYIISLKSDFVDNNKEELTKAIEWYTKAAKQGVTDAQYFLGALYVKGTGVPQNEDEAVKWFKKAAEQGNDIAQWVLDIYYEKGFDWFEKSGINILYEGEVEEGILEDLPSIINKLLKN